MYYKNKNNLFSEKDLSNYDRESQNRLRLLATLIVDKFNRLLFGIHTF